MKLGPLLLAARTPQNEKLVPFKPLKFQLKLRDHVSGKSQSQKEVACIQPMMDLITCLKTNDYNEKPCETLSKEFNDCYMKYLKDTGVYKKSLAEGDFHPVANQPRNTIGFRQLNVYLKKFPPLP